MVTHQGFGITTQEIDQHQEEIQVNYFQSSILQFKQKNKIAHGFKRVFFFAVTDAVVVKYRVIY